MDLFIGPRIEKLIEMALDEDEVGFDVTSAAFFEADDVGQAHLVAKQNLVMCGGPIAEAVFWRVDDWIEWKPEVDEGESVEEGQIIARVEGPAGSLLRAERTAYLSRMR